MSKRVPPWAGGPPPKMLWYEYKNPRITTRGVEHIAILESVGTQQENRHDVEDTYLDGNKSVADQQQ